MGSPCPDAAANGETGAVSERTAILTSGAGAKSPVDLPLRLDDATRRPQLHSANDGKN
jgi:hypothetical protein